MNKDWDESKHPRDDEGKFTDKAQESIKIKNDKFYLQMLSRDERYEVFLQKWAEMSEKYNDVRFNPDAVFTQVFGDEVEQFFGDELIRWSYMMSSKQRQALRGYTKLESGKINRYLRNKGAGFSSDERQYLQQQINLISSALADFNLQRNILVYRVQDSEFNKGDTYTLDGFTSTSINRRLLAVNNDGGVQYEIEVPKGQGRGAYIKGQSAYKVEYEFLLQRGTKVKEVRRLEDGEFKLIRLRVIDED